MTRSGDLSELELLGTQDDAVLEFRRLRHMEERLSNTIALAVAALTDCNDTPERRVDNALRFLRMGQVL